MNEVGGHRQPRLRPGILAGQDRDGTYAQACVDLAMDLGWEPVEICELWSFIALCREYENHEPRAIAKYLALCNVRDALDCRGREAS